MSGREWTITVLAPCEWLTANTERYRYERARKVKAWRERTVAACMVARLPKGVTPVTIHAVARHSGSRPPVRDKQNLAPTVKALVDGLTPARNWVRAGRHHHTPGYGLLPDDSDSHVLATTWDVEPLGRPARLPSIGEVVLTIREAS